MAEVDAGAVYKAVHYRNIKTCLNDMGLDDFDISLIENAEEVKHPVLVNGLRIQDITYDPRGEMETMKRLRNRGMVFTLHGAILDDPYFLSSKAIAYRKSLREHAPKRKDPRNEDKTDISLTRDGLLTTASKLWWVWTHGDQIREQKQAQQYLEFIKGHNAIEEALQHIATSEQRVSRQLIENPPQSKLDSSWTVDMQRASNDRYWASGNSAFWLNPNAYRDGKFDLMAEALPAPEWWSAPEYKSKYELPDYNKVLDEALLPPPTMESLVRQATPEEIEQHRREKYADDEAYEDMLNTLAAKYSYFVKLTADNRVVAFSSINAATDFINGLDVHTARTVGARGTITYGNLLREYAEQNGSMESYQADLAVTSILEELERMGEEKSQKGIKGPKGKSGPPSSVSSMTYVKTQQPSTVVLRMLAGMQVTKEEIDEQNARMAEAEKLARELAAKEREEQASKLKQDYYRNLAYQQEMAVTKLTSSETVVNPLTRRMGIYNQVKQLFNDNFGEINEHYDKNTGWWDLGLDSLDQLEFVMLLEEEFNVEISTDEEMTLGQLIDYLVDAPQRPANQVEEQVEESDEDEDLYDFL